MSEISDLKKRIEELEKSVEQNITSSYTPSQFANKIQNVVVEKDKKTYTQSDIETTISITIPVEGGTDTAQVLDFPQGFLVIIKDNKRYKVPYYTI